jgi:pyruvate dehydrogenase E2 component (dihydrolipoamide acetyltransferase)
MATPVVMPQMGESIAEGTIVRWIKKVGDSVDRDEPLFEISTDKVDAEIPSPAAGTLLDIAVKEGETVAVNSVVATIGAAGEQPGAPDGGDAAAATGGRDAPPAAATQMPQDTPGEVAATPAPPGGAAAKSAQGDGTPAPAAGGTASAQGPDTAPAPAAAPAATGASAAASPGADGGEDRRQKSSPLVRRIAKEHGVDLRSITGTGMAGRVTKHDILGYIERGPIEPAAQEAPGAGERATAGAADLGGPDTREHRPAPAQPATTGPDAGDTEVVPMSVMRKKIAEHMILSRRTSAHVYSVFEVNYSRVDEIRKARRAEYEQRGVKLTFTSFIAKVVVDCLRRHKVINASIDGDTIVYKRAINLGVAVALENGLIVPVVKRADELNILGLSRAVADVAERARAKKLQPEEVQGGTFTITNPGNFGAQFGLPIISQPQVAILGVGTIEKRPVVIDDMIGIRLMGYLTLGYDHRLVDGAVADQFMADVKKGIETFDASQV